MGDITDQIDENPIPGALGHTDHHKKLAKKANAIGDLVTSGRLSEPALNATYVPHQDTPPNPTITKAWADTSTAPPTVKGWNNSAWVAIGGGGGDFQSGSGSPLGSVTPAALGALYLDRAATVGAVLWRASGATNADWYVVVGDTGWASLTSYFISTVGLANMGIAYLGGASIRRIGASVYVNMKTIGVADTAKHDNVGSIPFGFRGLDADDNRFFPVTSDVAQLPLGQAGMREGDKFQFWFSSLGNYRAINMTWVTAQPWPTTLPGTPA
nr:MAG TPA_asm: hypothetical protein [Caudoviricetes sp.]